MLPVYGFHIDFQFWPKMLLPRDLWMPQTPRKQQIRPGALNLGRNWIFLFGMNFYSCDQLLDYAFLLLLKVCAFRTPLLWRYFPCDYLFYQAQLEQ